MVPTQRKHTVQQLPPRSSRWAAWSIPPTFRVVGTPPSGSLRKTQRGSFFHWAASLTIRWLRSLWVLGACGPKVRVTIFKFDQGQNFGKKKQACARGHAGP